MIETVTATDTRQALVVRDGDECRGVCLLCPYSPGLWESEEGVRSDLRRHLSEYHPPPSMEDRLAEALRWVLVSERPTWPHRQEAIAVLKEYEAQQERTP